MAIPVVAKAVVEVVVVVVVVVVGAAGKLAEGGWRGAGGPPGRGASAKEEIGAGGAELRGGKCLLSSYIV